MNIVLFADKIDFANTYSLISYNSHAHVRVEVMRSRLVSIGIYIYPTKNIIEDLTSSVQISQEMLRSSYKIYLIRTQVKNLTCSYQISLV